MNKPVRKRVLVVDDTEAVQLLLRRWITLEGYDIDIVSDGDEALKRIESVVPDLILLDVMMPGINGYAVCRKLRENNRTKSTPIIIITALQAAHDSEEAKMSGANEVIVKPLERDDLVRRIRAHLGSIFS
jgi:DNA-binding response OmpR family regulator